MIRKWIFKYHLYKLQTYLIMIDPETIKNIVENKWQLKKSSGMLGVVGLLLKKYELKMMRKPDYVNEYNQLKDVVTKYFLDHPQTIETIIRAVY